MPVPHVIAGSFRYDTTEALFNGEVTVPRVDLQMRTGRTLPEIFSRLLMDDEFDIAELGMTFYQRVLAAGRDDFVALPLFPNRVFRHSCVFVNVEARIETPADLVDKTIGEFGIYSQDSGVWAKGALMDDYGFDPAANRWVIGGLEQPAEPFTFVPQTRPANVDITDLGQVRAAVRPTTRIIYAETIANPTTAVADLRGLSEIAHESGALLVIDSTLAPPVICRPLEHGADLVIHSATKYIGGHSDVTGGVVTGRIELISNIRGVRVDTGGSLAPDEAFLLRRGLETLPLRVRRACSTASVSVMSTKSTSTPNLVSTLRSRL